MGTLTGRESSSDQRRSTLEVWLLTQKAPKKPAIRKPHCKSVFHAGTPVLIRYLTNSLQLRCIHVLKGGNLTLGGLFGGPSSWKNQDLVVYAARHLSAEPWKNLLPRAELSVLSLKRKLPPINLKIVVTVRQFVCLCVFDNGVTGVRPVFVGGRSESPYSARHPLR